jgi:hypothetical protein
MCHQLNPGRRVRRATASSTDRHASRLCGLRGDRYELSSTTKQLLSKAVRDVPGYMP